MPIKLKKSDIKDKIDNPAEGYMILGFDERGKLVWKDEDGGYGTIVPTVEIGSFEILEIGNYLTVGYRLSTLGLGLYSIAHGNDIAASGLSSYAQGSDAIALGDYSTAKGEYVEALGNYSYVAGRGWLTGNKLTSAGISSFVHSYADVVSGTWSDYSVILGGQNHNIGDESNDSSDNSAIIGGDTNYIGYRSHNSVIIGGNNNEIENDIENSVVLGGSYINATMDNAVYVPRLVLRNGTYSTPMGGTIEYDNIGGINHFKGYIDDVGTFAYLDGVYASTLTPSLTMLNAVGGYGTGTTVASLTGRSFIQMFDKLLFPTIYPTYDNMPPDNLFTKTSPSGTIFETDLPAINISFTNTYITANSSNTSGRILLNGIYQNNRGGDAVSYNRSGPSLSESNNISSTTSISFTVTLGTFTWNGSTNYAVGPQPYDNTGTPYDSPYPSGTTANASTSIEGVLPYYATTVDNSTLTKQTLISMSWNYSPFASPPSTIGGWHLAGESGVKQKFDVPTVKGSVTGVKWWNTSNNSWEYQGGSKSLSISKWTKTTSTSYHSTDHSGVSYDRYTYNDPANIGDRYIYIEFV